jgi:hypothetical protein
MKTGITNLSIIPVRASANERSEQVSQLLFGESYEIMQKRGNWIYIRSLHDDYEGWIDKMMSLEINESDIPGENLIVLQELINKIELPDGSLANIPAGSVIPKPDQEGSFMFTGKNHKLKTAQNTDRSLTESSKLFLNTPYLWGGKSPFGMDCSGYVQLVYRMHDIYLPRDASMQVEHGETICFRHDAKAGDLAFFENTKGKIIHVGIILDENQIIHASGKVRIDILDHSGIYNRDISQYSHTLSVIKRIIS